LIVINDTKDASSLSLAVDKSRKDEAVNICPLWSCNRRECQF